MAWLSAWALAIVFENPAAGSAEFGRLGTLAHVRGGWHRGLGYRVARRGGMSESRAAAAIGLPVALAPILAATAGSAAVMQPWLGYHVLTGVWLGIALAAAGVRRLAIVR